MLDENNTLGNNDSPAAQPPEESGNRTFLIVGGIFAGLIFLTIVCMAVYFLVIQPKVAASQAAQQATIEAGNQEEIAKMTATAGAALWTKTPMPSPMPTNTRPVATSAVASQTPVVNSNAPTQTATSDPATMAAMQTQLALQMTQTAAAQGTRAVGGEGPLPTTGFADEVGLPLLILLTFALLAVIFVARRMRKAPTR
jgi:hypothetical protein